MVLLVYDVYDVYDVYVVRTFTVFVRHIFILDFPTFCLFRFPNSFESITFHECERSIAIVHGRR